MGVDLTRLAEDEERVRVQGLGFGRDPGAQSATSAAIQNVLDALNYYRCLALHNEQEMKRAETSKAEAWAAVHVRDAGINVTVKKLRAELERSEERVAALMDIGR